MKLANNRELYDYLIALKTQLESHGCIASSQSVAAASRLAAGMSTEFLGESRIALRQVAEDTKGIQSEVERADLVDVLDQLDKAFDSRSR